MFNVERTTYQYSYTLSYRKRTHQIWLLWIVGRKMWGLDEPTMLLIFHKCMRFLFIQNYGGHGRVAKVGSHSARAKMATKIFRHARICYSRNKCVVFARKCKFANLIQYNMQYIPWNTAHLAQETLFLTKKSTSFCPKTPQKCKIATNLNIATKKHILGLKIFFRIQTFRWRPFVHNFCHPGTQLQKFNGS